MNASDRSLTVVHSYPVWLPQTQTWMYSQISTLQKIGVEAHVACEHTQNLEQFHVANIHCLSGLPWWFRHWDALLRRLKIRRHLGFLVSTSRKINAQILHSHFGHIGWQNLAVPAQTGMKHVVTFYGVDVNMLPTQSPKWRLRYAELFSKVDLILCEGSHMARCIVALGCPEDKVRIQHLGVDVEAIPFQPRQYAAGAPLKILIAASFREKKGIPDAIAAVGRLRESSNFPIELTIIGDAGSHPRELHEKSHILAAIERWGLQGSTRLLGYQKHQAMLEEAYKHHIFLSPSVTASDGDTEGGAPVSLIEMVASGMPIVSTLHCDIPEIVPHGQVGLLAEEHDVECLERHLRWYAENPQSWAGMLEAGREHVEREYGLKSQTEKLVYYYRQLLEGNA